MSLIYFNDTAATQRHTSDTPMPGHPSPDRLASHMAAITVWFAQTQPRAESFTPAELERALGRRMRALALPLVLCGWRRTVMFSRRTGRPVSRTLWLPPGAHFHRPARGRPRFDLLDLLGTQP